MTRQDLDRLLGQLSEDIAAGPLDTKTVSARLTAAAGGSDAEGAWSWRRAYDVVQAAAILADREAAPAGEDPRTRLARLGAAAGERPTETRRSEAQIRLQQFSTPLPYAQVAATAAPSARATWCWSPRPGPGRSPTWRAPPGRASS